MRRRPADHRRRRIADRGGQQTRVRRHDHVRARERRQQPRSDAVEPLRGSEPPLRDVRLARTRRPERQHHSVARGEVGNLERRQDRHLHAAQGCQVPGRHDLRRRLRQVEHRALQDDGRVTADRRSELNRYRHRRRCVDGQVHPQECLRTAARRARRPRWDDGLESRPDRDGR